MFLQVASYTQAYQNDHDEESIQYNHLPQAEKRSRPSWTVNFSLEDLTLSSLLNETYVALDKELFVLTAVGIRTSFDRASELLGIAPDKKFKEKLDLLLSAGKIGTNDRTRLEILVDAGSAAAHRGWKPQPEDLEILLCMLENFIHQNLILTHGVNKLSKKVPQKTNNKTQK